MVVVLIESWMELLNISGWGICGGVYDIGVVKLGIVPLNISRGGIGGGSDGVGVVES